MKKRVNWTINPHVIKLLKQAKKLNGSKTSLSDLVEFAVKKTFKNELETAKENTKHYLRQFHIWKDKLEVLEKENNDIL